MAIFVKCIYLFSLNQLFKNFLNRVFFVLPIFGISKLTFLAIFCGMFFKFTLKPPKKIPSFYWLHGWNLPKETTLLQTPLKTLSVECQEMGWTIEKKEAQWNELFNINLWTVCPHFVDCTRFNLVSIVRKCGYLKTLVSGERWEQ